MLNTTTNGGLHEFVGERILARYARPGVYAADLGAGPGAMAARLQSMGCDVVAVDRDASGFSAEMPHISSDFNQPDFAQQIGATRFNLVTAIEVIEHVESPIGFLRNIGRLLAPGGVAVLTTPNVDSLPARAKFLFAGKIRTMDEHGEPTHISPIFFDLLQRQFLPLARLPLREHGAGVESGFGTLVVEMGIGGLILWLVMSGAIVGSAWKVVKKLRGSPWFPLGFIIFWYAWVLLFPATYGGMAPYEDFLLNAYFWLLLGVLFRLPTLALSAQFALNAPNVQTKRPWMR